MDIINKFRKHGSLVIVFLFLLFLCFSPFLTCFKGIYDRIIFHEKYYSIAVGISIILLGFFYYFHRITVDVNMKKTDFRRINLKLLLDGLNDFELSVDEILSKNAENDKELKDLRLKMRYRLFAIIEMIKYNNRIFEFTNIEKDIIFEVTSFVDKSNTIMTIENADLKKELVTSLVDLFKDKIIAAKKICFIKMAME